MDPNSDDKANAPVSKEALAANRLAVVQTAITLPSTEKALCDVGGVLPLVPRQAA